VILCGPIFLPRSDHSFTVWRAAFPARVCSKRPTTSAVSATLHSQLAPKNGSGGIFLTETRLGSVTSQVGGGGVGGGREVSTLRSLWQLPAPRTRLGGTYVSKLPQGPGEYYCNSVAALRSPSPTCVCGIQCSPSNPVKIVTFDSSAVFFHLTHQEPVLLAALRTWRAGRGGGGGGKGSCV
jgi:hypothetical protein